MRRMIYCANAVLACVCALSLVAITGCKKSDPDAFARLTNVGKNYYDRGEAAKALTALQQAVALNPTHPDAQINAANAYLLANQPDAALKHALEALRLDPNSAPAHFIAGCVALRQNRFEDALKELQKCKDIDPSVAAVSFQLGLAHQALNHNEEAIAAFQETTDLEPEHPSANYRLSQLLIRAGKPDEAKQAMDRHQAVLTKKPNPPNDVAVYERCRHTNIRLPFKLEQPDPAGVKVMFADVTATAFGTAATYRGPVGVIDLDHDGRNSLFVREGEGFRLLVNSNGVFRPHSEPLPGIPGAKYHRCLVAELHQDRFEDVIVLGEQGTHVFKFVTNVGITEVSRFAGMTNVMAMDGALVDLDFTGKLDLLALAPGGQSARLMRNLGNFYFRDHTATSGLPATLNGATQLVLDDWNGDDLSDVFFVRAGQPPLLLTKLRGGPLTETNSPTDWPVASRLVTGDLNNDLHTDAVLVSGDQLICIFNGMTNRVTVPLNGFQVAALKLVDYDNDGWLDLCAVGQGLRIWRNLGRAGFRDVAADLGLTSLSSLGIEDVTTADFDGDCDTDFLLSTPTGLRLLRNDGGSANRQLKLRLIGHRSNPSGLGMRIEVTTGGLRTSRTISQLPLEIGVGKYPQIDSMTVRWFDLAVNAVDTKVECGPPMAFEELQLPTGSCPYLYAWDGQRFRFVTDLLGAAPLGLPVAEGRYIEADADEHVWIGNETNFPPRDGKYVLQITEELREVLYLDEAKLVVVDHPPGTEVHTTGKLVPSKSFPPHDLVTLHRRRPLLRALNHEGRDVTAALTETDGQHVSPTKLRVSQLRGLAEPHGVTLDFGALEPDRPWVLALTGWLRFGGGMANIAASHNPDLPFPFPTLEVEVGSAWQPVNIVVGAPAGKTKTILVDLAGKLPPGARRLRVNTAFEIHWDHIALFERDFAAPTRITTLAPTTTDLHWRGFSEFEDWPAFLPLTPNHDRVNSSPRWRITPEGWCTRYGEVDALIATRDNALALLNGGDELTLSFATDRVPPKAPGMMRDFFLFSSGWDKDADFHCKLGWQVGPLPWHGMDDQHYGDQPRPVFPGDELMRRYNIRWVGPLTLARRTERFASNPRASQP